MTVAELVEALKTVEDQTRVIVLASDAEGNNYSALGAVDEHVSDSYHWIGDDRELWSAEDAEEYDDGSVDAPPDNATPCIVIWPA